ncbi:hypothetical protein TI05_10595 [Achromatium sp. WMS3]|nr:hypothetical protein TI05_10595 [Achromatium sp. WMS3]
MLLNSKSPLTTQFGRRLFTRREDITDKIRLYIAAMALHAISIGSSWGTISALALEYNISRTFIYALAAQLREAGGFIFSETTSYCQDSLRALSITTMLSLRFEGQTSIGATSQIMKRFECQLSYTGSVSQTLSRIGHLLPSTFSNTDDTVQLLVFASDEIFAKSRPILLTVDPYSSVILRIELANSRTAEDWRKHFQCISNNGVNTIYLVSDQGTGIIGGHADAMNDVVRQSDTYHAIAHVLGQWVNRLDKKAYKEIGFEEERQRVFKSAKSKRVKAKRLREYKKAGKIADQACELADNFRYIYLWIVAALNVFDNNGDLRTPEQAAEEINLCLDLIEELNHAQLSKAANKSRRTLPDLLHYFNAAKKIVYQCQKLPISSKCLKSYCLAWQWDKVSRKNKNPERKRIAKENAQFYKEAAARLHKHTDVDIQEEIFKRIDGIVQSSQWSNASIQSFDPI